MTKRITMFLLLLSGFMVFSVFSLAADQVEPEDPEIVLPPMLLQIEDIEEEIVEAVIPENTQMDLPAFDLVLPEAGELELPQAAFDIPIPDQVLPSLKEDAPFFSEGMIGMGTNWHILGDISLYKLGAGPRFILHFAHDGMDGYNFNSIGQGFNFRNDLIEASITMNLEKLRIDGEVFYQDRNHGLQGIGDYGSVTHRFFGINSDGHYQLNDLFSFAGALEFFGVNRDLSGAAPVINTELFLAPAVSAGFDWRFLSLLLSIDYRLGAQLEIENYRHHLNGGLSFSFELPLAMNLDGKISIEWPIGTDPVFPFFLAWSGIVRDYFSYRLEGGYEYFRHNGFDFWQDMPFIDQLNSVTDQKGWYGALTLKATPIDTLEFTAGADFGWGSGAVASDLSVASAVSGLVSLVQDDYLRLTVDAGIEWNPIPQFSASLDWSGQVLEDKDPLKANHQLTLMLSGQNKDETYGGGISADWEIYDQPLLPVVSLNGFINVAEGIEITLDALDILAPIYENGRPGWGGLIQPGFDFVFKTKISL